MSRDHIRLFKYKPLDYDGLGFRILCLKRPGTTSEIECELVHAELDSSTIPYEALSYAWGCPERSKEIYMHDHKALITSNLYEILKELQHEHLDRYLWIDDLCINQEDVRERGHQVQNMRKIYRGAERVIVYLGRPTELPHRFTTSTLMHSLQWLHHEGRGRYWPTTDQRWDEIWKKMDELGSPEFGTHNTRAKGLEQLLKQAWFRRVWISQEVANARSITVQFGTWFVPASVFTVAPRLLGISAQEMDTWRHVSAVLELMTRSRQKELLAQGEHDLFSLLVAFRGTEASDERDKIWESYPNP
ncbi:heterokaryon incompatibility protein-domain-containing protein [Xylariomycetidae sp. FL2044]|nr:heterokaryon incompatibility protein-domain-containing protein [Xylariomycetidae sp. FL2044]